MDREAERERREAIRESPAFRRVRDALGLECADDSAALAAVAPLLGGIAGNGRGPLDAEAAARLLARPHLPETTFAVVDIETTGGRPPQHRITELAALKVRAGRPADSFDALVNPRREIPWNVSRLTGITDAMVADKPGLMDALPGFLDFIEGCVFVAHCANFDFGFLRYYAEEFLGRDFSPPVLCTFELASRLLPEQKRFNLGELGAALGVRGGGEDRHRALGDARATAEIFIRLTRMCRLLGLESLESLLAFQTPAEAPPPPMAKGVRIDPSEIEALPRERGVYRLYDGADGLLFAGRANDLRRAARDLLHPRNRAAGRFALKLKDARRVEAQPLRSELVMNLEAFRAMRKARLTNGGLSVAGAGFLRIASGGARPGASVAARLLQDGARYYGPFRKKAQLADLLEAVCSVFPIPGETPAEYRGDGERGALPRGRKSTGPADSGREALLGVLEAVLEGRLRRRDEGEALALLRRAWQEEAPPAGRLRRRLGRLVHLTRTYALSGPSVERRRLVIVEPGETRERRRCYLIRDGLLAHELAFERGAPPVRALEEKIGEIFRDEGFRRPKAAPEALDEAAVVAGWMRRELMEGFVLNLAGRPSTARVVGAMLDALGDPQAAGTTITP